MASFSLPDSELSATAHQAYLLLQKLAAQQQQGISELLRTQNLSGPQYNVLRILRGSGAEGLTCSGIGERLLVHDPDVTRLLDRLERASLIRRERHSRDRRVILSFITPEGLKLLGALDEPTAQLHAEQFAGLDTAQLKTLAELLTALLHQEN